MSSECCRKTTRSKCDSSGPGYLTPLSAMNDGPQEKLLYVTCVSLDPTKPDYLAVVDVDQKSTDYGKVVNRCEMPNLEDELHHSGWNTCSSCYHDSTKCRNRLVLPCLNSDRIYIVNISGLEQKTCQVEHIVEPTELHRLGLSAPHTAHCLPNGHVMVSCLGDQNGNGKGSFLLLDGQTFKPLENSWNKDSVRFGYDYWYQPKFDILVSSEWGSPKAFRTGFDPTVVDTEFGSCLHFWQWTTGKLLQTIDLSQVVPGTSMPLEVRFLHNPDRSEGFVGCALSGNIFRFFLDSENQNKKWKIEEVIRIQPKQVKNWSSPELPSLITDILISLDDRFLYCSAWAFGEVRQYNIEKKIPELVSIVRIGGMVRELNITEDREPLEPEQIVTEIGSTRILGGAQMLQLSLDGKRLYVTNSLHSAWDRQFYPKMTKEGSQLVKIDVDSKLGGMKVNTNFVVDFGLEPNGPSLAHEMRYPGGDCTSDIWL